MIDDASPGIFTDLRDVPDDRFAGLSGAATDLCRTMPTLFVQPYEA